ADQQDQQDNHRMQFHAIPDEHGHDELALRKMHKGKEAQYRQSDAGTFGRQGQQNNRNTAYDGANDGNSARDPSQYSQYKRELDPQQPQPAPDDEACQQTENELPDDKGPHDSVELVDHPHAFGQALSRQEGHKLMLEFPPVNQKVECQHRQDHDLNDVFQA